MPGRMFYLDADAEAAHATLKAKGVNLSEIVQDSLIVAASGTPSVEKAVLAMLSRRRTTLEAELEELDHEEQQVRQTLTERRLTAEMLAADASAAEERMCEEILRTWPRTSHDAPIINSFPPHNQAAWDKVHFSMGDEWVVATWDHVTEAV